MVFSYASLLVLPVCIILLVLFPQMRQTMIDNAYLSKVNGIARLGATLDLHLSGMISTAVELGENMYLTPYAIINTGDGDYRALQEIKKSKKPSSMVSEYFYYLKDNNRFYSSNGGVYPLSWLADTTYGYCYLDWDEQSMAETFQVFKGIDVRPLERIAYPFHNVSSAISVMIPVPVSSSRPYGVLLIWLDEAALMELISPTNADPYECTLIFDGDGQCIMVYNGAQVDISSESITQLLTSELSGQGTLTLDGKEYICAAASTKNLSWRCVSLTAMDSLLEDVDTMWRSVFLIIVLLLISGVVITVSAIRSQYIPIRSLANKAQQYASEGDEKNEFETVHHALESLKEQTENLKSRMEDSLPEVRRQKLLNLISGQFPTLDSFNEACKDVGLYLSLPALSVAVVRAKDKDPIEIKDYLDSIAENFSHGLQGYFLPAINGKDVLFISAGQTPQSAFVYLTDICADISATQKCDCRAALGSAVTDPMHLSLSYSEATACLDRMLVQGQGGVQRGEASTQAMLVPTSMLYRIELSIEKENAAEIETNVLSLIEYLRNCRQSAQVIRVCYLNALSGLVRAMDEMAGAPPIYKQMLSSPKGIGHDEMELNLKNACAILLEQLKADVQSKVEIDIEDVKAYITEHCLSYDFTIQMVADHFNMSYSGFSHFFKRRSGFNCKQFVDDYRIDQAVLRIMQTMKPLEVIAQEVGFSNASAFIRFFKKSTGRTPGSYRNL